MAIVYQSALTTVISSNIYSQMHAQIKHSLACLHKRLIPTLGGIK